MIYFLILFMVSTSCFGAQQPKTPLQKLAAQSSMPTPKYPSQYTISYTTKTRPYTAEENLKLAEKKYLIFKRDTTIKDLEVLYNIIHPLPRFDIDTKYINAETLYQIKEFYTENPYNPLQITNNVSKKLPVNTTEPIIRSIPQQDLDSMQESIKKNNQELQKLRESIDESSKDITNIEQQRISFHANVQQKSQLPYQGKKDESSFLYKLLAWSEKHKLEKQIALQKAVLQKHINFILQIPTLEEYSQYLDSQKLTFLDKMMQKNEFIRQQATWNKAKEIILEHPEIIFSSSAKDLETQIQDVFKMIVEDIQRQP